MRKYWKPNNMCLKSFYMKKLKKKSNLNSMDSDARQYFASASFSNSCEDIKVTAFKAAFRYYKSKISAPSLNTVLDLSDSNKEMRKSNGDLTEYPLSCGVSDEELEHWGLRPFLEWHATSFKSKPGLILVPNIFSNTGQLYWARQCLHSYAVPSNITNLDKFLSDEDKQKKIADTPDLLKRLRWVTLGYHYNWDDKFYAESSKSAMPKDLCSLSKTVAGLLGFKSFNPEAAIINFYKLNSTLSGHVDGFEWNLGPPILSLSFGQTAIYLQGGPDPNDTPMALFLRGGDLLIMHGNQRLDYHGVPKIIKDKSFLNGVDQDSVGDYLSNNRINITVRQMN